MKKQIFNLKKLTVLTFLALSITTLVGCGAKETYHDSDFDGLYNDVDPLPNNNEHKAYYIDSNGDVVTNTLLVKMDYRDFIHDGNPDFNVNLARLGSMFTLDTYPQYEKAVLDNEVSPRKADSFYLYDQFGITDFEKVEVKAETDPYDACILYLGNHKFSFEGKDYQTFFITVSGYIDSTGWISNVDVGADTKEAKEIFGEHPEWLNKEHHKGFDVTANRAYDKFLSYINKYKDSTCESVVFGSGHSRGGALMNLIAKKFDDDYPYSNSTFYCLNTPLTTTNLDNLSKYTNILSLICDEDIVSYTPSPSWGFDVYGKKYHFSHEENVDKFNAIRFKPYNGLPANCKRALEKFLDSIVQNREGLYQFSPLDEENNVFTCSSKTEALLLAAELKSYATDETILKCIKIEIVEPSFEGDSYKVCLYTKPCVIIQIVTNVISLSAEDDPFNLVYIISEVLNNSTFIKTYISLLVDCLMEENLGISDLLQLVSQMTDTHGGLSTVITSIYAKPYTK